MAIDFTCEDNEIQEGETPNLPDRQVVGVSKRELKTQGENQFLYIF